MFSYDAELNNVWNDDCINLNSGWNDCFISKIVLLHVCLYVMKSTDCRRSCVRTLVNFVDTCILS